MLLKEGRAKFYQAFSKIRKQILHRAIKNAWIWQRRLAVNEINTTLKDDAMKLWLDTESLIG
ncbi:hypothetical protein PSAR109036_05985 [Psychrobacter arenosus]|uniref:hypothetical protein n=1 Tax=Psychrobacter arenosus TaxID=256326 RepID=UPI0019187164|nr:hypothetical protein [Psychrobacter arenosus]